jgi:hypothetical protein
MLVIDELGRRPSRATDLDAENVALTGLAETLANEPRYLLQRLVQTTLELCRADSAGVSILEPDEGSWVSRWHAIAGMLAPNLRGTLAPDPSACGTAVARDSVVLLEEPAEHFVELAEIEPRIHENLLVPFYCDGKLA